ncbi:MAG: dihydropteroate synthase [Bacteroidaceae bacterium]|nr:dihydropteroate synthase [Bacteroidaceae bacterium]
MNDIPAYTLNVGGVLVDLSSPCIMGILNATPDSFFADSRRRTEAEVAERACRIVEEGGGIIDVGAVSTRPGASEVDEAEELNRLRPALAVVRRECPEAILSVDTFRAGVVERMYDEFGPFIVNDISGGADPEMFALVARLGLPYVLTHNLSAPSSFPFALPSLLSRLRELGQKDVIIDPGFGFNKTLEENYRLFGHLAAFHALRCPLLVGISRKSMIHRLLDITPAEALNGTTVLHTLALREGAHILRVHDVKAAAEVIKILQQCSSPSA